MRWNIQSSPLGIASAIAIAMSCLFPFFIQGNPYASELLWYWTIGGAIAFVVALVAARATSPAVESLGGRLRQLILRPSPFVFAALLFVVATVLSLVFVVKAYDSGVSTSDEVAQLWHAKMLAHGFLSLPADPNPEFFAIDNVIDTGRWYSQFPIGAVLVLVPGVLLGVPFLVNPVLAGLSAGAFSHFTRVAFGEFEGRVVAVLFAVTPNILMMAGTYMNHVPVLFLATAALAMLVEWDRASSPGRAMAWAAGLGLALGAVATIRPLDAVILSVVIGAFQLREVVRTPSRARELLVQGVAGAIAITPLLYANWVTNGSALRFGYEVMWGANHGVGFHADPQGRVHTLSRALFYATTYVNELNISVMSWPFPAMMIAFVGLAAMKRATKWDILVLGLFFAQLAGYAAYWGRGEFLGPRFLFTALPSVVVILGLTPFRVAEYEGRAAGRGALAFLVACTVMAWGPSFSKFSVWGTTESVRQSRRAMRLDVSGIVRSANAQNALVFVREPFAARLLRRMWGAGVSRGDAAILLATRDACSLLDVVRRVEAMPELARGPAKAAFIDSAVLRLSDEAGQMGMTEPQARLISAESLTPECAAEADDSKLIPGSFGAALPLEPIGPDGRLAGNVIYAMDLSDHNEVLRERFGLRTWYRLVLANTRDGVLTASLRPY